MYKATHVFKWPHNGEIAHYLDIKHPNMYKPVSNRDSSWGESGTDLFKWYNEFGENDWILERIKPLVLENK